MKASKASIGRAIAEPRPPSASICFTARTNRNLGLLPISCCGGLQATKFIVSASITKSDPATLVDEAGAMSLFGGKRAIWIEPATKDIEEGVVALLEGADTESPVIAIAGPLPASSALRKLAEGSPLALAYASYSPEGQEAERMVIDLGRRYGLKVSPPIAARLAEASGNDQAIVAQELQKLALYIDASPQMPKELEDSAIDAVGADLWKGTSFGLPIWPSAEISSS